jgi:hypothetical protein
MAIFYSEATKKIVQNNYLNDYGIKLSDRFMECFEAAMSADFEKKTGLKVNKHISFSLGANNIYYEPGSVTSFKPLFHVNHNWFPVTIKWKSKSGRIYDFSDTDIDCDDIEFWFDHLDVAEVHRLLYPQTKLPFNLKDLSYTLVVTRINMDCTIEMTLKDLDVSDVQSYIQKIDKFIADYNERSEKKNRKDGVIHNWKTSVENKRLIYELDLGSTGPLFFKKLLPFLSQLSCFDEIEIC